MSSRHSCGWVIRYSVRSPRGRTLDVYWSGPDKSWGQHFGPLLDPKSQTLSIAVAVFSSRRDARLAIRDADLRGCVPMALESALDRADHWEAAA